MDQPDQPGPVVRRRLKPLQISVGGMVIAIICFAAVFWSWRNVRDQQHPMIAKARALKSRDRDERLEAARWFLVSDAGDSTYAAAVLMEALSDQDVFVRSEVVHSLGVVSKRLLAVPGHGKTAGAIRALAGVLLDRDTERPPPDSANLARAVRGPAVPSSPERNINRLRMIVTGADDSEGRDMAQVLNDPSWMAARALGEVAPNTDCADIALDALTLALRTDGDARRLRAIVRSLGRFGSAASAVLPDLMQALRKSVDSRGASDPWLWVIADSVVRIDPGTREADEAVAALVDCLRSHDDKERQVLAIRELMRLGSLAHAAVPALIDVMKDEQTNTEGYVGRQWVPEAIGKIAPGTPAAATAIEALSQALDVNEVDLRLGALQALARFGPAAKSAIPRLEALKKAKVLADLPDRVLKAVDSSR